MAEGSQAPEECKQAQGDDPAEEKPVSTMADPYAK